MQVTWTHSTHLVQHLFGFQTILTVYSNAEKKKEFCTGEYNQLLLWPKQQQNTCCIKYIIQN